MKELIGDKGDEERLIILMRLRDYYNPILEPEHTDKFKQFVVCLIAYYVQKDDKSPAIREHLQELCSQFGSLFSAYLKSKLSKIFLSLKDIRDNSKSAITNFSDVMQNLLKSIHECQIQVLNIFECPSNSKLLEILEQSLGHLYQLSNLFMKDSADLFLKIVSKDIELTQKLVKKFNPALTNILLNLLSLPSNNPNFSRIQDLTTEHLRYNLLTLPHSQLLTSQLQLQLSVPVQAKYEPLQHLRLQSKKPKELPSFNPHIDDDFMATAMDDRKFKRKDTPQEVKRKVKKAEKDALRELRKDTMQIQVQKQKDQQYRNTIFKKSIVRAGNVKDDI